MISRSIGGRGCRRNWIALGCASLAVFTMAAVAALGLRVSVADAASTYAHVGGFSGYGSADGELVAPRRAVVDPVSGNLLVVDSGNDRVQVFDPTPSGGAYLAQFGGGVLDDPFGIAVDSATGAVYVADAGNDRIVRFTSNGLPVPTYTLDLTYPSPALGVGVGEVASFRSPIATVPGTGDLVVGDTGSQTVKRFNPDGSYDGLTFDGTGSIDGVFVDILDLAVDSTGDVIVVRSLDPPGSYPYTTSRARVDRFSAAGAIEARIGLGNVFAGVVAVNSLDQVVVSANQRSYASGSTVGLRLYSPTGTLQASVPLPGGDLGPGPGGSQDGSPGLRSLMMGMSIAPGATGRLYAVTDIGDDGVNGPRGRVSIQAFRVPFAPVAEVAAASAVTASSATLNGTVDANEAATSYRFEYRAGSSGDWTALPDGGAGSGGDPVDVSQPLSGLTPNTTYEFRLVVTSADGTDTSDSASFTTQTAPPDATTLDASQVKDTSVWLHGEVNPSGEPTRYWFEYGTTNSYGSRLPADTDASAGQGVAVQPVSSPLFDLQPNTTYHFRIVAVNATGRVEGADGIFTTKVAASGEACPNEAVRTQQGSTRLPDCRAYEQVSPRDKAGYEIGSSRGSMYVEGAVAPDGERMSFTGFYPLPGSEGGIAQMVAARDGSGWRSVGVTPRPGPNSYGSGLPGTNFRPRGVNPAQTVFAYWDTSSDPVPSLGIRRADGTHRVIAQEAGHVPCGDGSLGSCPHQAWFAGMSDDGSRILFESAQRLGPAVGLAGDREILYEWIDDPQAPGGGELRVVNRTNSGSVELLDTGHSAGLGGTNLSASARRAGARGARNAISDGSDGHTRVFFQSPAPSTDQSVDGGPVYMREDGEETVELSAPEGANAPSSELRYLDASADGSLVFLWSGSKLTDDPGAGEGIYRYDTTARDLAFVAAAPEVFVNLPGNPYAPPTALASDDGSRLYYQRGDAVHVNASGVDRLIAGSVIISAGDLLGAGEVGIRDDRCPTANVSPGSGRYFAFVGSDPDGSRWIRRYDAEDDELSNVADDAGFTAMCNTTIVGSPRELQTRVMSEDGRFVFFDTKASVVARDTNNMVDTYRWDARDGGVELISSGTGAVGTGAMSGSPGGVTFIGTDATGANAFFATSERLAVDDRDRAYDIYNARIGGGFWVEPEPAGCESDACQGFGGDGDDRRRIGSGGPGAGNVESAGRASFAVAGLSAAQRRALAAGRRVVLRVRVSDAGRVSVIARARVRGRMVKVGGGARTARSAGSVRLGLRLSGRARKRLKANGRLGVVLSVRFAGGQRAMRLDLRRSK